jgi:predicted ferric reductase
MDRRYQTTSRGSFSPSICRWLTRWALWCAHHQPQRVVHLYYGVRNSAEHAYKVMLEDMARGQRLQPLHLLRLP